jgi:hypothetical protein
VKHTKDLAIFVHKNLDPDTLKRQSETRADVPGLQGVD